MLYEYSRQRCTYAFTLFLLWLTLAYCSTTSQNQRHLENEGRASLTNESIRKAVKYHLDYSTPNEAYYGPMSE